jgi:hypothetical protein
MERDLVDAKEACFLYVAHAELYRCSSNDTTASRTGSIGVLSLQAIRLAAEILKNSPGKRICLENACQGVAV